MVKALTIDEIQKIKEVIGILRHHGYEAEATKLSTVCETEFRLIGDSLH